MANEKRLISLDEALKATHSEIYWTESQQAAVRSFLVKQPNVDAVEVVRCKKCLYRSQYSDENGMYKCGGILTEDGDCFLMVKPDHFCAFGERRSKDGRRE